MKRSNKYFNMIRSIVFALSFLINLRLKHVNLANLIHNGYYSIWGGYYKFSWNYTIRQRHEFFIKMVRKCCVVGSRVRWRIVKDPSNRKSCFTFPSKEMDPKRRAVWIKYVRKIRKFAHHKKLHFWELHFDTKFITGLDEQSLRGQ